MPIKDIWPDADQPHAIIAKWGAVPRYYCRCGARGHIDANTDTIRCGKTGTIIAAIHAIPRELQPPVWPGKMRSGRWHPEETTGETP